MTQRNQATVWLSGVYNGWGASDGALSISSVFFLFIPYAFSTVAGNLGFGIEARNPGCMHASWYSCMDPFCTKVKQPVACEW
eukprot:1021066-Amphidinium_carterae.2